MEDKERTRYPLDKESLIEWADFLRTAGVDAKVFTRKDGKLYLAMKKGDGTAPHIFGEVESKQAARNCGAMLKDGEYDHTNHWWNDTWDTGE